MLKSKPKPSQQNSKQAQGTKGKAKGNAKGKTKGLSSNVAVEEPLSLRERMAQKRKADRIRKELIQFTTNAICAAILFGLLLGLIGGIKVAAAGVMVILILALSFKYPRYALWGFFIYLPFGGTITYAIGNSPLLQLAKDGFYIPALIGMVQYCRQERLPVLVPKQLMPALGTLLGFCILTLFIVNAINNCLVRMGKSRSRWESWE